MTKLQHEERVVRILAIMEGEAVPLSEVSVPRAHLPIDVVMSLSVPSRAWGPLQGSLAQRTVVVEHFSGSPSIAELSRSLSKHAFVVEEWWRSLETTSRRAAVLRGSVLAPSLRPAQRHAHDQQTGSITDPRQWNVLDPPVMALSVASTNASAKDTDVASNPTLIDQIHVAAELRPPALLVLSAGYPRMALSSCLDLPASSHPGIWRCHRPLFGDIFLVHLRGLPVGAPGCAVLRFMATPRNAIEADELIDGLLNDQTMLDSVRNRIMEHAMNRSIPITANERGSILERIRAEAKEHWLNKGRIDATARDVLRVLEVRGIEVSSPVKKRIRACRDLETLEAWLEKSLSITAVAELFG